MYYLLRFSDPWQTIQVYLISNIFIVRSMFRFFYLERFPKSLFFFILTTLVIHMFLILSFIPKRKKREIKIKLKMHIP